MVRAMDRCRKVVDESEKVFGPNPPLGGPLPPADELRGLQFTEACLRESLRKYRYVRVDNIDKMFVVLVSVGC